MQRPSRYPLLSETQWREIFHLPPDAAKAPESAEERSPNAELARLRRELALAQAEIRRLKTPPPGTPAKPTSALP